MIINKNYTKLLFASFITRMGDSIDTIAFSWLVYTMTGSRVLMGTIFTLSVLPNLVILPFSGVLADVFKKKVLVVISDNARGISVLILAFLYITNNLAVWHLFMFVIINNLFESFADPARSALIPTIIKREELVKGNSYLQSAVSLGSLIGLGTAGIIIGLIGIGGAIAIDAATFFISGFVVLLLKVQEINTNGNIKLKQYFSFIKEGFSFLAKHRIIFTIILVGAAVNFLFTPYNVLVPVYVDKVLQVGVIGLTYLGVALMIGMIVGGLIMGKLAEKVKPINAAGFGLTLFGIMYIFLGLIDKFNLNNTLLIVLAIFFVFIFGVTLPIIQAPIQGAVMKKIPHEKMGRVMSTFQIFARIAMPLGGALVSIVGDSLSVVSFFMINGALLILLSSTFWLKYRNTEL